jgi:hypothetical protein
VNSIKEQIAVLQTLVVEQGTLKDDLNTLKIELHKTLLTNNTGCAVVISGNAGSGKTTLVKKFKDQAEAQLSSEGKNPDAIYLETPSSPVGKDLYITMLQALGTPNNNIKQIEGLTERALKREILEIIKNKRLRLLILDEFQHVTEKLGDKKMRLTSDFLKSIINNHSILLVFAGTEDVEKLLDNEQFESRTSVICKKTVEIGSREAYVKYISYLKTLQHFLMDDELVLESENEAFCSPKFALPIFYESRGDLRIIRDIIHTALAYADSKGSTSLRRSHFVDSWKQRFRVKPPKTAPFTGNTWKKDIDQLKNALGIEYDIQNLKHEQE